MEEWQEVSPPEGSRALVEAFMVEVLEAEGFTVAEAVAGNSNRFTANETEDTGERTHAHKQ